MKIYNMAIVAVADEFVFPENCIRKDKLTRHKMARVYEADNLNDLAALNFNNEVDYYTSGDDLIVVYNSHKKMYINRHGIDVVSVRTGLTIYKNKEYRNMDNKIAYAKLSLLRDPEVVEDKEFIIGDLTILSNSVPDIKSAMLQCVVSHSDLIEFNGEVTKENIENEIGGEATILSDRIQIRIPVGKDDYEYDLHEINTSDFSLEMLLVTFRRSAIKINYVFGNLTEALSYIKSTSRKVP